MAIKKSILHTENGFNWLFVACIPLSIFPVLPYGFLSIAIVFFILANAIEVYKNKQELKKDISGKFKKYVYFTLFYILLIVSSFWSEQTIKALNSHTVGIPILLFPLCFIFNKSRLSAKQQVFLLQLFIMASIVAGLLIIGYAFQELSKTGYEKLFYTSAIRRNMAVKTAIVRFHPTYISLCFVFSIGVLISWLKSKQKPMAVILKIIAIAFLFFLIIICASRAAILTILIAGIVFFLKASKIKTYIKLISIAVFSIVFYFAITNIFLLSSRFLIISQEWQVPSGEKPSSISIRYGIYKCSAEIIKNHWLLGVGVGDLQNTLNDCYSGFPTNHFKEKKVNTHNYYLHLFNSAGIFSVLAMMLLLFYLFKIAITSRNNLFLLFLLIVAINLTFENLLVRSYGVVFFAFLLSFFFLSKPAQS